MRVLLVNPNRYRRPAVPPVGIEYLVAPLRRAGHEPVLLDLCFAAEPQAALAHALDDAQPEAVGFTVRNVDTVLYHTNESFLDEIASLVTIARAAVPRVLIGGSGVATMPETLLRTLGVSHAIDGPGEAALPVLLDRTAGTAQHVSSVINGWAARPDPAERHPRGDLLDYAPYLEAGARFGFETQKGCAGRCIFCTEAARPVLPRRPEVVADEVAALVELGATQLFCCDSEFNQSLAHCKAFLRELIARGFAVDWTLYMKPLPHDAELFELLARSGCSSITLSVDTLSLYGPTPAYAETDLISFLDMAKRAGITVAVDLVVGLPGEPAAAPRRVIELFRRHRPATVGINPYMRLYPGAALLGHVLADPDLRRRLEPPDPPDCACPVFYHHLDDAALERLIAGDPLFRIEGREPGVNYERIQEG
jgi:radical SAM superfamily enzyme YgiQ (UPF0313 family)